MNTVVLSLFRGNAETESFIRFLLSRWIDTENAGRLDGEDLNWCLDPETPPTFLPLDLYRLSWLAPYNPRFFSLERVGGARIDLSLSGRRKSGIVSADDRYSAKYGEQ